MNTKRIEEIQKETAYPDSISVQQALLKVWNECEQEKNLSKNGSLANVVCCALCNTELEDYEIATCQQMGATDPEMICETCWNRIQNEGYENVMP